MFPLGALTVEYVPPVALHSDLIVFPVIFFS